MTQHTETTVREQKPEMHEKCNQFDASHQDVNRPDVNVVRGGIVKSEQRKQSQNQHGNDSQVDQIQLDVVPHNEICFLTAVVR